ncbi:Ankyrin repeat domain-containing protein 54 [Eufriesea mexicana]|uniref:Ankyrin repeat domain-containing protein 54 n=1 Tax=Eufriesea mexicana TaxID=516756 RepID=A0A310S8V9_9HYME|nr:Ankyrin repeat domain-containing protein 54 [Eufriesea mexicana]
MTSVDSGIETSNNSDDSSIAQNEDVAIEEMNNVSSSTAVIVNNQNEIQETGVHTTFDSDSSVSLTNVHSDIQYSIPTSSSRSCSNISPNILEIKIKNSFGTSTRRKLLGYYVLCRKIKFINATRRNRHFDPIRTCVSEHRMRIAAATNNTIAMRRLLNSGVSPNTCDIQGRTPLHLASCRGYTEMVRLLLEHGADPNLRDSVGNTPLHLAAVTSKISVVTLLLNAGTDPLCLGQYGYNPLHLAQTKLKLLRNYRGEDMLKIKEEVQNIVNMLFAYLQKLKDTHSKMETLNTLCSRLSLSNTPAQVQDDVKDLLANLDALSITQ